MSEQKRNTCKRCGILVAPGKSFCIKCGIETETPSANMAAKLEKMEKAATRHAAEMEEDQRNIVGSLDFSLHDRLLATRSVSSSMSSGKTKGGFAGSGAAAEVQNLRIFARLERLCSEIRHSIVEACFYNLRLQSQMLPQKIGSADFMQELRRNLEQLPLVSKRIKDFFDEQLGSSLTISSLFKDEQRKVMTGLQQLQESSPLNDETSERAARLSRKMGDSIDAVISGLKSVDDWLCKNKIDVKEVVRNVASILKERCDETGVKLSFQLPDGPLPKLFVSADMLSDSILELARNSLKHAFPRAEVAEKRLEISARVGDERDRPIIIQVADNGCGLSPEILGRARREESSADGSGFGLPMVIHNIEKLCNGKVHCESIPDGGTKFILSIPSRVQQRDDPENG
jgi:signal transduction histidine kinase